MYIDAHAHLDRYASGLPDVVREIEASQIFTISVSMDPDAYARARRIVEQSGWIVSAFGVHPWEAPKFHGRLLALEPLIDSSPLIGEVGLDYHFISEPENHALQRDVFRFFVRKSVQQRKILNVHSKGAEADVNRILGELGANRIIMHWYSGPMTHLSRLAEKGAYFTVGVEVLFSPAIRDIARAIPSEPLLTETDNPGGYQWLTNTIGMPSIITSVVEAISGLRAWSVDKTKHIVQENFFSLVQHEKWVPRHDASAQY